jgi:FdhD protein
MGHEVAERVGLTMIGRASGRHYLAFTGRHRLARTAPRQTMTA